MMINPERNMLALAISGPTHQQQTRTLSFSSSSRLDM